MHNTRYNYNYVLRPVPISGVCPSHLFEEVSNSERAVCMRHSIRPFMLDTNHDLVGEGPGLGNSSGPALREAIHKHRFADLPTATALQLFIGDQGTRSKTGRGLVHNRVILLANSRRVVAY